MNDGTIPMLVIALSILAFVIYCATWRMPGCEEMYGASEHATVVTTDGRTTLVEAVGCKRWLPEGGDQ